MGLSGKLVGMRTAIQLAVGTEPWSDLVSYVTEAERLGVDHCWVAEAWGGDAATPIAALSQHTNRMVFGSGVFQVGARSAANTAMTASRSAASARGATTRLIDRNGYRSLPTRSRAFR